MSVETLLVSGILVVDLKVVDNNFMEEKEEKGDKVSQWVSVLYFSTSVPSP